MGKKTRQSRTGTEALKRVANLIKSGKARNIVVLAGAGISTSAGIPDFRSPETGLYHNLQALDLPFPEAVFELGYFKENPKPFWTLAKELYPGKHHPTPTHYLFKLLSEKGLLQRVFTQNIDTLEHQTGLDPRQIIEAHGSFASAHCLKCKSETSTEYVLSSGVRYGEVVYCAREGCGGLVKPDIVFFGEGLPDKFFENIKDLTSCDLLIVIGTSLQVQPFAQLPFRTSQSCPRILINREAVGPFSNLDDDDDGDDMSRDGYLRKMFGGGGGGSRDGDMFFKGDADEGTRLLVQELGWEKDFETMLADGKKRLEETWRRLEGLTKGENEARVPSEDEEQRTGEIPAAELAVEGDVARHSDSLGERSETETKGATVGSASPYVTSESAEEKHAGEEGKAVTADTSGIPSGVPTSREKKGEADDDLDDLQKAIEKELNLGGSS